MFYSHKGRQSRKLTSVPSYVMYEYKEATLLCIKLKYKGAIVCVNPSSRLYRFLGILRSIDYSPRLALRIFFEGSFSEVFASCSEYKAY